MTTASLPALQGFPAASLLPVSHPALHRYAATTAMVVVAAAIRGALGPVLDESAPMLVFMLPTVLAATLYGTGSAVFATMLGAVVGCHLFIQPLDALGLLPADDRARLALFAAESAAIIVVLWRVRVAWTRRAVRGGDQAARLLRAVLDSSPHAIVAADRYGRVTAWNAEATRLFGFSANEVVGSAAPPVVPEERASFEVRRARALHGERFDDVLIVHRRKDGSNARCRAIVAPLRGADDRIVGTVSTLVADPDQPGVA